MELEQVEDLCMDFQTEAKALHVRLQAALRRIYLGELQPHGELNYDVTCDVCRLVTMDAHMILCDGETAGGGDCSGARHTFCMKPTDPDNGRLAFNPAVFGIGCSWYCSSRCRKGAGQ